MRYPSKTSTPPDLFLGIDVGTQGLRAIATNAQGSVVAQAKKSLHFTHTPPGVTGLFEQDPRQWWEAATICLRQITSALGNQCHSLRSLAVTATSGTICVLDAQGRLLRPAMMYRDQRAKDEATRLNDTADRLNLNLGYHFNASSGLPKLLWIQRHEPGIFARTRFFAHAGDVLVGQLTGIFQVSDWSQALKSGYDLLTEQWPVALLDAVGLPLSLFPRIVPPGTPIGNISPQVASETGLPTNLVVVAGMTDGCTAQIAGGAVEPGQWLSVLGTTLVFKGVTPDRLRDAQGRIYTHRHPQGMWLPGSASNTGGDVLARQFPNDDLRALDMLADKFTPTGIVCYPLQQMGERFPFACPTAEGFVIGAASSPERFYTACLEGVGYVERLAYETLHQLGATIDGAIRVTGGGARSRIWLRIRASILKRSLLVPQQPEAVFGAAVLAASATSYPDLITATREMVHMREEIAPSPDAERYDEPYEQFVAACRERGYLSD